MLVPPNISTLVRSTIVAAAIGWCAQTQAASLATAPLFLGDSAKPNIILAIDDSGSMDFETLFDTNDGSLWWDNDLNSFVELDGSLVNRADRKYSYLFPNGRSSTYNGSRLYDDGHPAIPPVKAYGFARSAKWNRGYYDPTVTYEPWPSYDGTTWQFSDVDPTKAPWDPVFNPTTFYADLTQNINSGSSYWTFYIQESSMVCDDFGNTCSAGTRQYNYFPATYYYPKTSGTYTYDTSGATTSSTVSASTSIIIEAEDGTPGSPLLTVSSGSNADTASNGTYVDAGSITASYDAPPSDGLMSFNFTKTGTVYIWVRRLMASGSEDSFWLNLTGHGETEITPDDVNDWVSDGGERWYKWRDGHSHSSNWLWERWAVVNLNGASHTLNIKYREPNSKLDQILITSDVSIVPAGIVEYNAGSSIVTRDCATDADPLFYREFVARPGKFVGVDAIAPDGTCLAKYEIKPTTASYPSGRSYNDELQNFANWFTYYRRRHQAMRGGLADAFQGLSGIRTGLYWFNNRRTISMFDMDTEQQDFLDDHYQHVRAGGTPLRQAFHHAGQELVKTGSGAIITDSCQKNFTLLFTDGFASDTSYSGVSNEDSGAGSPYSDNYSGTAADIAYKYYAENLRPDLDSGNVSVPEACLEPSPSAALDCNTNLHMNTYSVGLGAKGTLFDVTHSKVQNAHDNPPTWPNVTTTRDATQIDDLYHAAVNGKGEMFNASTPEALRTTLSDALRDIISRIGAASGVTFNTSTLSTNSVVFTARFNSAAWNGELNAIRLSGTTGEIGATAWEASEVLDNTAPDDRVIITHDGSDGIPFRWADLPAGFMRDDLNTSPDGTKDSNGELRLNFLRGDTSKEGAEFRERSSALGDIVHSSPLFVGSPEQTWPDAAPFGDGTTATYYSTFKAANKSRAEMVYIGANDGMLHGFSAEANPSLGGGKELLAYIPSMVYSDNEKNGLHYLTDPDYTHRYYVDLAPIAADVYIKNSATSTAQWRTVLIGGLRNGGRGLFALDVTDPGQFKESNAEDLVLWEFTPDDDADLGDITTKPVVAMMNNDKWAVIFGNGYNSSSARLFILFIEEGVDGTWSSGDYIEIDTGVAGGLSQPAVADLNGDRIADRVYAGDLEGNIWAFDLSNKNSSKWEIAKKQGSTYKPLFTAKDSSGNAQPITSNPVLTLNPNVNSSNANAPNVLVFFGTGIYLSNGDPADKSGQSFYGVWDSSAVNSLVRSDLQELTIVEAGNIRDISGTAANFSTDFGFFMDLPTSGERVVITPRIRGGIVFFNTTIPENDACAFGGSGWLMSIDLATGLNADAPVFDTNDDNTVDDNDTSHAGQIVDTGIPSESGFLGDNQYTPTSAGTLERRAISTGEPERTGRLAWDEIIRND